MSLLSQLFFDELRTAGWAGHLVARVPRRVGNSIPAARAHAKPTWTRSGPVSASHATSASHTSASAHAPTRAGARAPSGSRSVAKWHPNHLLVTFGGGAKGSTSTLARPSFKVYIRSFATTPSAASRLHPSRSPRVARRPRRPKYPGPAPFRQ